MFSYTEKETSELGTGFNNYRNKLALKFFTDETKQATPRRKGLGGQEVPQTPTGASILRAKNMHNPKTRLEGVAPDLPVIPSMPVSEGILYLPWYRLEVY